MALPVVRISASAMLISLFKKNKHLRSKFTVFPFYKQGTTHECTCVLKQIIVNFKEIEFIAHSGRLRTSAEYHRAEKEFVIRLVAVGFN